MRLKSKTLLPVLIVCIVFISGQYFISDSFAQGIEKSLGSSVGDLMVTILGAYVLMIIPVSIAFVVVLKMEKKLTSSRIKTYFAGAGLLFLGLIIVLLASNSFISDEERSARDSARIAEEKAERNLLEKQVYEKEKELAKFKEVYADNGRLKYRPHWLVGDGYKELEYTGYITRDEICADLVDAANAENVIESFYLGLWLGGCVKNPHDDYADILDKGGYLKYRLYWDRADIQKNIDNR